MKQIALLDNYDSFTYNLVHLIEKVSNCKVHVFLNDQVCCETLAKFRNVILSPGPGLPSRAGIMPQFLKGFSSSCNILGVCLGMQAIGECFHSDLKNLETVMHGTATPISHNNNDFLFQDIPTTYTVGRYHSWVIDKNNLGRELEILAMDQQSEIMAIRHKKYNIRGVQFHPESILSEYGESLLKNWIEYGTSE